MEIYTEWDRKDEETSIKLAVTWVLGPDKYDMQAHMAGRLERWLFAYNIIFSVQVQCISAEYELNWIVLYLLLYGNVVLIK